MPKIPDSTDVHVGRRVRMRRMMLNLSQSKLGEELGLTFQQVQKYEKGTNRISASRLQQLSRILDVPLPYFFEGAPGSRKGKGSPSPDYTAEFLSTADGLALTGAFMRIPNVSVRRSIVHLVEQIASSYS